MSYFALIVSFAEKYDERYGIGTIISTMLPYSIGFGIIWTLLLIVWILVGFTYGFRWTFVLFVFRFNLT